MYVASKTRRVMTLNGIEVRGVPSMRMWANGWWLEIETTAEGRELLRKSADEGQVRDNGFEGRACDDWKGR